MKTNKDKKRILADLKKRLEEKGATAAELKEINIKFDTLVATLRETLTTQIITKVMPNVRVENLKEVVDAIMEMKTPKIEIPEFPTKMDVKMEKPAWYKAPEKILKIDGEVSVKQDQSGLMSLIAGGFGEVIKFFSKTVLTTQRTPVDAATPQAVMLYDPIRKQLVDLKELFTFNAQAPNISISGGGASAISFKGGSAFQGGTLTIATAGARIQLPNIPCSEVLVQAHEGNSLLNPTTPVAVVVGGSNVVAASATRNGIALYATNSQVFKVANANMLWVDTTDNSAIITYTILS